MDNLKTKYLKLEDLDITGIKINDTLSTNFFDSQDHLSTKIKDNLLRLVEKFIDHVGLDNLFIKDIVMTGSLANYNYNDKSDVDVHILSDLKQIDKNEEMLTNFFKEKKNSWADKYDISVFGHPVELYVEDYDTALKKDWVGMYSLTKDKWLQKPDREKKPIDYQTLETKSTDIAQKIDKIINDHSNKKISDEQGLKQMDAIWKKITALRDKGLNKEHSEFSLENLIFKVLRNNGYFDKMDKFEQDIYSREYSINEKKKILIIKESQYKTLLKKLTNNNTI